MVYKPQSPYNDLPLLPPKNDVNTTVVLSQCIKSARALAELKGAGSIIPDQSILINAIPLQEAKLSSEIENIVTTQDDLYLATLNMKSITDPKVKEVLRYRTALRFGYDELKQKPLDLELIRKVCCTLSDKDVQFREENQPVYIVRQNPYTVIYTPPTGGKGLLRRLKNLEDFLVNNTEFDPLVRMVVAHYQFEAIHPFMDGNGRTGRILNILFLLHSGLLNIPVLYLSRFIIQNKPDYYRLLRNVTEKGAWEPWMLYMLKGVEETALWTTNRIHAIHDLLEDTIEKCRKEIPGVYSKELIELIFKQPYCKIKYVVDAGIAERQTASVYLQELERIGILIGEKRGRETIYKNPALVKVLTA
jgi:Fic family protein